jgi:hypothetical protein
MQRVIDRHVSRLVPGFESMAPLTVVRALDAATGIQTHEGSDPETAAAQWLAVLEP